MKNCGSGGNQWGKNNHMYKGGYRVVMRDEGGNPKECQLCGSDKFLIIHHKDENRENNKIENLQKICRKCHAKIHKLNNNFKSGSSSLSIDDVRHIRRFGNKDTYEELAIKYDLTIKSIKRIVNKKTFRNVQ